jgi:hypothetical protein
MALDLSKLWSGITKNLMNGSNLTRGIARVTFIQTIVLRAGMSCPYLALNLPATGSRFEIEALMAPDTGF